MSDNIISDPNEIARLDALTEKNREGLARCEGPALDRILNGLHKRYGRTDTAFRAAVLENTHPDDLAEALESKD